MAILRLTIDDGLLRRAQLRAQQENTSVPVVVREYLATYAGSPQVDGARARLVELSRQSSRGSGFARRTWDRDNLHSR